MAARLTRRKLFALRLLPSHCLVPHLEIRLFGVEGFVLALDPESLSCAVGQKVDGCHCHGLRRDDVSDIRSEKD
jgi:hypothetical protein